MRMILQSYVMIPALKAAIAHYGDDPGWTTVRPPLVALTQEEASALIGKLAGKGFAMPGCARKSNARATVTVPRRPGIPECQACRRAARCGNMRARHGRLPRLAAGRQEG